MKIFSCSHCQAATFFENRHCTNCGYALGFDAGQMLLVALEATNNKLVDRQGRAYRYCENYHRFDACNWLIPAEHPDRLCRSCQLTRTLPDMRKPENRVRLQQLEEAKRRMVHSLLELRLPIISRGEAPDTGLCFDFKLDSEEPFINGKRAAVLTGHAAGVITINALEADPDELERRKANMGEHYRSLLGHFRHEIGHYYWDVLIRDHPDRLARCRQLFGDETRDYGEALKQHYANPNADWQATFISVYASSHPWEDWAESWAHYLHIIDSLATASEYELSVQSQTDGKQTTMTVHGDRFAALHERWVTLATALNSLNRSMGVNDPYPFTMPASAIAKLEFIHDVVAQSGEPSPTQSQFQAGSTA